MKDPALRAVMRRYLALDDSLRNNVASGRRNFVRGHGAVAGSGRIGRTRSLPTQRRKSSAFHDLVPLALAASVVFLLGLGSFIGIPNRRRRSEAALVRADAPEPVAQGFAVIGRLSMPSGRCGIGPPRRRHAGRGSLPARGRHGGDSVLLRRGDDGGRAGGNLAEVGLGSFVQRRRGACARAAGGAWFQAARADHGDHRSGHGVRPLGARRQGACRSLRG